MEKKKLIVPIVASIATVLLLTGISYAYFSAKIKETNKTETVIKSNELGLIFTGETEINENSLIPGDSFTKTFKVENTSNRAVTYNIYMQNIINEFNEDLVYTLTDETGEVVAETKAPDTNTEKTYILSDIEIGATSTKNYTLKVEFKYLETPQNVNQGASFKATLGIDANKVENPNTPVETTYYYAFGTPTTSSTTDYTTLGKNVFARIGSDDSHGVCINDNGLFCLNTNDYDNSVAALKAHFGESSCTDSGSDVQCNSGAFYCLAASNGYVGCSDISTTNNCYAHFNGSFSCR